MYILFRVVSLVTGRTAAAEQVEDTNITTLRSFGTARYDA